MREDNRSPARQSPRRTGPVPGRPLAVLAMTVLMIATSSSCVPPTHGDSWVRADISATPMSGPAPLTVHFDGSGSTGAAPVTRYEWDFGDGTPTETGVVVDHTYTTVGTFTVLLIASGDYMLPGSASVTVTTDPAAL